MSALRTLPFVVLLAAALPFVAGGRPAMERPARSTGPVARGSLHGPTAQASSVDCDAPGHREFDFWIGEWDVANRQRNPATPEDTTLYETGSATSRVYPILGGCGIVEHWEGDLSYGRVLGFSLRSWDPARGVWTLLLDWPGQGSAGFSTLEGRFDNGVGSFRRARPDGRLVRYRFLDITERGVRWEGATSADDGESWEPFWVMEFRRRDPATARALLSGPSRTARRCPSERARAFDFLIGDWRGEERSLAPDGTTRATRPIALRSWSILEGCGIMDLVAYRDDLAGPADRFRVRSFATSEERWVQYTMDRGDPTLVRWEASAEEDREMAARTSRDGPPAPRGDERLERVRWLEIGPDGFRRRHLVSDDGGVTWRPVADARLQRR